MFLNSLKYEILTCLRNKDFLMWLVLFPIILGTFFKIVFADLYEKEIAFHTVPTAIVQTEENEIFDSVIESVTTGDEPLLAVTECSEEEALALLKDGDVSGIIYADDLSLTVSGEGLDQTIIRSFLEQYKVREEIITEAAKNHPEKIETIVQQLSADIEISKNISMTDNEMDPYAAYFYNLIAMVALFGSVTGLHIAVGNQANLSAIGARNNCSPVNKLVSTLASLCGSFLSQGICVAFSITFLAFVLGVDFGSNLGFVYLAGILGGWMGVAMGFFVGSISRLSEGVKNGIAMSVSMTCCFLSGLMVADIKGYLAVNMPWVNKINPAAVISDSLQCLVIFDNFAVYTEKIITMIILTAVFTLGGFLLSRRRKYASL